MMKRLEERSAAHHDAQRKHWMLYDGACGMCRRMVGWVRRRDTRHEFEIVAYQDSPQPPMTPQLYEACRRAVHVIKSDGQILRAGQATLFILESLGRGHALPRILRLPPFIWLIELGYKLVARHRQFFSRFLFSRDEHGNVQRHCRLPLDSREERMPPITRGQTCAGRD